jgi:pectate lyase
MAQHPRLRRPRAFAAAAGLLGLAAATFAVLGPAGPASAASWPTPTGTVKVTSTITVSGTFDGGLKQYYGLGDGGQSESQPAMFDVKDGGTIKNVILGAPAGDGIHCLGSCTISNVWWLDVGEDAATFKGTSSSTRVVVDGGGARSASDKVFQHNGGGTVTISNFSVENFGKLYRSCGNCSKQYRRTVVIRNVTATAPGKALAGINTNYGDTATFSGIRILGDSSRKISICDRYTGNSSGKEPTKTGSGPDGTYCRYAASDVRYG